MKITATGQLTGPAGKPIVVSPVEASLNVPFYYFPKHPTKENFCSRIFAETVLATMEAWAAKYHFGLVHIGIYNPRPARHADGTPIVPRRWSNHAHGLAMDFKGITTDTDVFMSIDQMQQGCPAKFKELLDAIRAAILKAGRHPEFVDEGGWYHIGIWRK